MLWADLDNWQERAEKAEAALREKEAELASVAQELEQLSTITAGTCGACGCNLNVYAAQSRELESVKAELAIAKQEREDIRLELLQIGCDQHISKSHPDGTVSKMWVNHRAEVAERELERLRGALEELKTWQLGG